MATNALVQARIDGEVKEEASTVLATMGLTVSDAVRMMLNRIAVPAAQRKTSLSTHTAPFWPSPCAANSPTVIGGNTFVGLNSSCFPNRAKSDPSAL